MVEDAVIAALALSVLAPVFLPLMIALRRRAIRLGAVTALIAATVMVGLFFVLNQIGGYPNVVWWIFYPLAAGGLTVVLIRVVLLNTKAQVRS